MKKRIIITKQQLSEYITRKRDEKTFYDILENIHTNMKNLSENVSIIKSNQSIIDYYRKKGLINENVRSMLVKHNIINNDYKIL